jgi:hypothetical protein
MSVSSSIEPEDLAREAVPGIRLLPLVHGRVEWSGIVRSTLAALNPAALAVELPVHLREPALQAVRRLPRISVVLSDIGTTEPLLWIVSPGDPMVEAMRWALGKERSVFFIDPDLPCGEQHRDAVPDPYLLWSLGPQSFVNLLERAPATAGDLQRERGMAANLQEILRRETIEGELLCLVGAGHVSRLADLLLQPAAHPLARPLRREVELRNLHPESLTGLLPDPPLAHAIWEVVRDGAPPRGARLDRTVSRPVSVVRHGLRLISGEGEADERQRRRELVDYAARSSSRALGGQETPDRRALGRAVWKVATESYRAQTRETVQPWQRRLFFDFATRYARLQGLLTPGLFEWVVAARGVADDNLAWEVFDAARTYPWQEVQGEIPTARLDGEELDLGTRRVRFRRRFLRQKRRSWQLPVRRRPQPQDAETWLQQGLDSVGWCSYPAEDLIIEDYARFLQQRAVSVVSAERTRVEPFTTGMLDGLDLRETLLNFHQERIYVREWGRAPGAAGAVVVIFDRDPGDERFPFRMTWIGEHEQESDMSFYSTDPKDQVVGPGILRATYGGFMMSMPRGRQFDVWSDPDYRWARGKAEVLSMAAADYSRERIVVHVAESPPSNRLKRYAAFQDKRFVHIPLASLSPVTLRTIRVVHLLSGRDKRSEAKSYIW